jgi:hypothetical protein
MTDSRNGEGEALSTNAADQSPADSTRNQDNAHTSAPNGVATAHETAPSKSASKASSTRNSTPASTSMDIRPSAYFSDDASANPDALQEARDASNATPNPVPASSKDSDENGAAPYGTRSRNRPGRSRPNYAEDTEMDFEMTAASANGNLSDPPSRNSVAAEGGPPSGVGGKKGSGPAQGNASWGNSAPNSKDNPANPNISGAPAVAAPAPAANQPSPAQPPVKRRKNAATTNGNHASASAPSQAGAKRGNHVMGAANSARESNMLTFENTGALLKDGRMEADDGQTVSINGKF